MEALSAHCDSVPGDPLEQDEEKHMGLQWKGRTLKLVHTLPCAGNIGAKPGEINVRNLLLCAGDSNVVTEVGCLSGAGLESSFYVLGSML